MTTLKPYPSPLSGTWTQVDHDAGFCEREHVGKCRIEHPGATFVNPNWLWSSEDYHVGACRADQVGDPKPEHLWPIEAPSPKTYDQKLSELSEAAVDTVLSHPGGAKKWFQDNPSAHVRVLVKLATPAAPDPQARVVIEIPWIQQGRLSYREPSLPIETEVTQVQDVTPKPLEPWKEQPQNPEINLGVNALKKNLS